MPVPRKRGQRPDKSKQVNGLYVHSSPPRVLQLNSAHIKQLIRSCDVERLESIVYDGQGKKLLGEYSPDYKVRQFLKNVPALMAKISLLHDAVNSGRLEELQSLLDEENEKTRKRLILAKDEAGVGLLHKAVYYDLKEIAEWIVKNYPATASSKDADGRTAFHYTPMCQNAGNLQKLLKAAGADPAALDNRQRSAKYYRDHLSELELPSPHKTNISSRKNTIIKESLNIKKSNIRIWIHQRDLNSLQQVVWEGHGTKLLVEHSNNPKVKRFLEAVPHILGAIRDVHTDVINDDLNGLKEHTAPPVPNVLFIAKDSNGLTPLHKAAGLGRQEIAEYIVAQNPKSLSCVDNEGRTPLHYSVLLKDGGKMFDYLVEAGADEGAIDNKSKSAAFYKTRNNEIDAKVLQVIPDSPRKANSQFDWSVLGIAATPVEEMVKTIAENHEENGAPEAEVENGGVEENNNENGDATIGHAEEEEPPSEVEPAAEEEHDSKEEETEPAAEAEAHEDEAEEATRADTPMPLQEEAAPIEEHPVEAEHEPEHEAEPETEHQAEAEPKTETEHEVETEAEHEAEPEPEHKTEPEVEAAETEEEEHETTEAADPANPAETEPEANEAEAETEPEPETEAETEHMEEPAETEPEPDESESKAEEDEEDDEKKSEDGDKEVIAIIEPEGVIEGIVNGENEIESVNEQGPDASHYGDDEITAMVESGNMEQLAALVLNGEGDRLLGHTSDSPELQAFLDNVPVYMSKINRIHMAARDGSLKDLQAALDRRKFAIAKDKISPNGASPLHVATIFGNTSIVRYLAGRFPETVSVTDDNGRTPLHYAAVVPDNGHYYNLLVHLGANTRAEDKFGSTPEFYRLNQSEFSHKILLQEYGAEEMAEEMLSDKVPDDVHSARKDLDDQDMITVLERCYNVLHGRRNSNAASALSTATVSSNSNLGPCSILSKHTRRYTFDAVKLRLTKYDHNLYDVIWPSVKKLPADLSFRNSLEQDFPAGIVIPDFSAYKVFPELLMPVIKFVNNLDPHLEIHDHPEELFLMKDQLEGGDDLDLDLDVHAKNIISGSLECTRNLEGYELPKSLSVGDLETVERELTSALLDVDTAHTLYPNATNEEIKDKGCGTYYTMNEILEDQSEARVVLASNGLMIPIWNIADSDRLHGKHWPYGRGVFLSNSCNLAVWINVLDHVRIVTCTSQLKPGNVGQIYTRIHRLMVCLNKRINFRRDEKLGFLSARPSIIGNTLQFCLNVRFPHLIKEPDNLRHLCHVRGLKYHRNTQSTDIVRIGNQQCLGITELQCLEDFCTAVTNILQLEKDLAMSNSLHIAALFVNMFKRKKASASEY